MSTTVAIQGRDKGLGHQAGLLVWVVTKMPYA
jgi:hypothetical protein